MKKSTSLSTSFTKDEESKFLKTPITVYDRDFYFLNAQSTAIVSPNISLLLAPLIAAVASSFISYSTNAYPWFVEEHKKRKHHRKWTHLATNNSLLRWIMSYYILTFTYPVLLSRFTCIFFTVPNSENLSKMSSSCASLWTFVTNTIQPSIAVEREVITSQFTK